MDKRTTNKIVVTGCAGFIGYHLCKRLLKEGHNVIGIDNLNDYYDVNLKMERLKDIIGPKMTFRKIDICNDTAALNNLFADNNIDVVVHLAAQAGVRYSFENPSSYINTNIIGFYNILECCRKFNIKNFLFASSSSVYGNKEGLMSENDNTDNPISLYAATKKCDETIAYFYAKSYKIKTTALRFFTVYGEYGRPDMAYWRFVENITKGEPIKVFNNGSSWRDFTYVDDIIEGIYRILFLNNKDYEFSSYNIGRGSPVNLLDFINKLTDEALRIGLAKEKPKLLFLPTQKGDVFSTYADTTKMRQDFDYEPKIDIDEGLSRFLLWLKDFKERK